MVPPTNLRLTDRDKRIIEAIYDHDGLLADYQIQRLFFSKKRWMQQRLQQLCQHHYLQQPTRPQRLILPCLIYWLGREGARYLAGQTKQTLRTFRYRKKPRWFQVAHDLAVNDFRLNIASACQQHTHLQLVEWITEQDFMVNPDIVEFENSQGKMIKKQIRPDGLFIIRNEERETRWLLEIDTGSERGQRFNLDKVQPYLAYLHSDALKFRSGFRSARVLVVTSGAKRMENLMQKAVRHAQEKGRQFYFTFTDYLDDDLLTQPIWFCVNRNKPFALLSSESPPGFSPAHRGLNSQCLSTAVGSGISEGL